MDLFALMCLIDKENAYKKAMQEMIERRLTSLWKSAGLTLADDSNRVGYYSEIDIMVWGKKFYGEDFCEWLKANHESIDIVLRLAKETSVVLLNGSGFAGPDWSVRASLANLTEEDYVKIGEAIRQILEGYYDEYKQATGK